MNLYAQTITQYQKMLRNLDQWLKTAAEFATKKGFDVNTLMTARLAPDQYPLGRQVQIACDAAKTGAASLTGQKAPAHPDTEKTFEELHARIATVLAYLDTFKSTDFEGADKRDIELSFMPSKVISGNDYLVELSLPNFYFHVTLAYSILRHSGVELGKPNYIGSLNFRDK